MRGTLDIFVLDILPGSFLDSPMGQIISSIAYFNIVNPTN